MPEITQPLPSQQMTTPDISPASNEQPVRLSDSPLLGIILD